MTFNASQLDPRCRAQAGLFSEADSNHYCLHRPRTWGTTFLLLLLTLRAGSLVHATRNRSCVSSNFTINSVSDAASLANCSTLFGDIIIDHSLVEIDISGPTQINGDLIMDNNMLARQLCSTSLTSITGTLALTNNWLLTNLTMPALTRVGNIRFQSSPMINLDFGSGIKSVESVFIDDSWLTSVDSLGMTSVDNLTLTNNIYLDQIYLPELAFARVLNISDITSFKAPQLRTIEQLAQFDSHGLSSLSIPALEKSGDLIIAGNTDSREALRLTTISLPSLDNCDDLMITNFGALENISFPRLKAVKGKLSITNNAMLEVIDFDDLTTVGADVKIRGLIPGAEFPSLQSVGGNFEISSANDISDTCDNLKRLAPVSQCGDGHIHGTFTCLSNNLDFNKDYCANSSSDGNTGVHGKKGSLICGLALALFSVLIL